MTYVGAVCDKTSVSSGFLSLKWNLCFGSVHLGTSLPVYLRGSPGQVVPGAGGRFGFRSNKPGQDPSAQVRAGFVPDPAEGKSHTQKGDFEGFALSVLVKILPASPE